MLNKTITAAEAIAGIEDGMTIGIGGWGPRRKPMALVRELLRSPLRDLTLVCYGGPEVGMLCAAGKLRKLICGFVSLDAIPIEPWFRKVREAGGLETREIDEGMLQWGLKAAGMRLPFLPTRAGLGTDVMTMNPEYRTVTSPYADGEVLLAMPALHLDVALIHVDRADGLGNTQTLGPDPYFDDCFARAAQRCYVSCETLVERLDQSHPQDVRYNQFERSLVTGVVATPWGAHPTSNAPGYGWDMDHLGRYAASAGEEDGWNRYMAEFVQASEAQYLRQVGGAEHIGRLPLAVF